MDYYGILYDCPAGARLYSCPINKAPNRSFKARLEWFENLNQADKNRIVEHHNKCSQRRSIRNI